MITFHVWRKMKGRSKKWRWGLIILGMVIGSLGIVFRLNVPIPFMQKTSFTKPEAEGLIASLLKNTYRAFDFKEESVVYDKLAISNEGDLLSEVYLQTKKSMILENQGGIQVKVKVWISLMSRKWNPMKMEVSPTSVNGRLRAMLGTGATSING